MNPVFRSEASPNDSVIANPDSVSEHGCLDREIQDFMADLSNDTLPNVLQAFLRAPNIRQDGTEFEQLIQEMRNLHELRIILHGLHGTA